MADAPTRIDDLLDQLTLEEAAALTAGADAWHTTAVERLGIGRLKVTDGPTGARGDMVSGQRAACFPVGVSLGATWDPMLLEEVGAALAVETRDKGAHVLLGPTINLQRTPLGGRSFECYSEDPWLTAVLATSWVRGLQAGGVGACVKHLVANDSEVERHTISSEVDERTLREVLLRPFELVVADADPWTIMAAYNRVNGTYACEHRWLLTEVLRDGWGWAGAVISDWGAVQSTGATAIAGCDLEMPGPGRHLGTRLAEAVRGGDVDVDEATVRTNARRLLHLLERAGVLDDADEPAEQGPDRPEHRALARRAAAAGTVLLHDAGAILPLATEGLRRVAVIGPNAEALTFQGGGSSQVITHPVARLLPTLAERLGGVEIVHEVGCLTHRYLPEVGADRWASADGDQGRAVELAYLPTADASGDPVHVRQVRTIGARWFGHGIDGLDPQSFSCRYRATFVPTTTGVHTFSVVAAGRARVLVDGVEVVDAWTAPRPGEWMFGFAFAEETGPIALEAGRAVEVTVEFATFGDGRPTGLRFGLLEPQPEDLLARAEAAAASADVALVVVGTNAEWETEGDDQPSFHLPGDQDELVRRVAAANPRTVVVLNAGSPVALPWADDVATLLTVWFPGYEGATALVDVLVGDAEPTGRLPCTFPVRLEDGPALVDPPASYPGTDGQVHYREGVLFGHRGYDAAGTEVRFPFGHGLGYTTWDHDPPSARTGDDGAIDVVVPVTNTGDRDGTEVVQVYVEAPDGGLVRPARQLVGATKVTVAAGDRRQVTVRVDPRALQVWDDDGWVTPPGTYRLHVGRSSRDLRGWVDVDR